VVLETKGPGENQSRANYCHDGNEAKIACFADPEAFGF
jgi:hypothetical protein